MALSIGKNYWKTIVFTFCLGWVVIWVYRSMLSPVYTEIQGTIGEQTNAAMGLISSCYFFGYTALQIPSGWLVDHFGQKRVLIPGFLIFAAGAAFIATATSLMSIYVGSVLAGMGCGCYYGAAFSLTAEHVPADKKGVGTAIVNSGSAVGMILGMTGSSFIVKQLGLPWQTMVLISAALIALMVVWYALMLKDNMAEKRALRGNGAEEKPAAASAKEDKAVAVSSGNKPKLFSIRFIACYALYFCTCYAYYMIVTWLPNFLETERGITGGLIGIIVSMISVTAIPGALFFSRVSDKRRDQKNKIILFLEISAFVLVAVSMLAPNAAVLAVVLLLYGLLGKLAVDPVLISYMSDQADPKNVATTLGVFNFFGMASSVIAPALTGGIIDVTGSGEIGFYMGAVLLLVGTILFAITNGRKKAAVAA